MAEDVRSRNFSGDCWGFKAKSLLLVREAGSGWERIEYLI